MLESIKGFFESMFAGAAGLVMIAAFISFSVGTLYWLWMAIQIGSFVMFLVILFPPAMIITGPIGIYSLIFGTPQWVFNIFG